MHRPGAEVNVVDTSKRLDNNAFGDVQAGWYWRGDEPPDLAGMQRQHDAYVATLRAEGVEVVFLDKAATGRMKSCFTREFDDRRRRRRDRHAARAAHPPRRGTAGDAHAGETRLPDPAHHRRHRRRRGRRFAWLNKRTAVIALSSRCNDEGATQIGEVLRAQGVELLQVQPTGYRLHIDGLFVMLAPDLALASITLLPVLVPGEAQGAGHSSDRSASRGRSRHRQLAGDRAGPRDHAGGRLRATRASSCGGMT